MCYPKLFQLDISYFWIQEHFCSFCRLWNVFAMFDKKEKTLQFFRHVPLTPNIKTHRRSTWKSLSTSATPKMSGTQFFCLRPSHSNDVNFRCFGCRRDEVHPTSPSLLHWPSSVAVTYGVFASRIARGRASEPRGELRDGIDATERIWICGGRFCPLQTDKVGRYLNRNRKTGRSRKRG